MQNFKSVQKPEQPDGNLIPVHIVNCYKKIVGRPARAYSACPELRFEPAARDRDNCTAIRPLLQDEPAGGIRQHSAAQDLEG